MMKRYATLAVAAAVIFLFAHPVRAARSGDDVAVVTLVEGTVQAFIKGAAAGVSLRKGERLTKDHEVKVGEKSRVEIRFPDGTVMRLAEKSQLKLSEVSYDKKTGGKNLKVNFTLGKLWANVKKLLTPDSAVEVKTVNAVAGVRGTIYRVNVEEDTSAVVKVYDGSVSVSGVPKEIPKPAAEVSGPVPVPGPHEVPPPYHEVTMEEWHVIVKSMQQITISPQGVASEPQDFTPQEDMDDWVKWNQQRDRQIKF